MTVDKDLIELLQKMAHLIARLSYLSEDDYNIRHSQEIKDELSELIKKGTL